ncbi:hypothetical protein EWM64_g2715 [Hericium alpestre]|uniref:Peptidase A1 domain-containing protein n=1 Tax=Hericium alpestre TaxID=135208 RepID=A0A4Z0A4P2_9AGAM|nr:hypothetical protein EWM64_g2715 [Hericium alpestre]
MPGTDVTFESPGQNFWQFPVNRIRVNDHIISHGGRPQGISVTAIIDTGSAALVTPPFESGWLMAQIPGLNVPNWTIPCDSNAVISFEMNGKIFRMRAADLAGPVRKPPNTNNCVAQVNEVPICGMGPGTWIFGSVILKNWHVVLDGSGPTNMVRIAQAS